LCFFCFLYIDHAIFTVWQCVTFGCLLQGHGRPRSLSLPGPFTEKLPLTTTQYCDDAEEIDQRWQAVDQHTETLSWPEGPQEGSGTECSNKEVLMFWVPDGYANEPSKRQNDVGHSHDCTFSQQQHC
jgi:hypothetical protein